MTQRTHFVYEAYDAEGVCLYIGCTGNPGRRYREHMAGNGDARGWFHPFVARWRVSGPCPKRVAQGIERARIREHQPVWNGTSAENSKGCMALVVAYLERHRVGFTFDAQSRRPKLYSIEGGAA